MALSDTHARSINGRGGGGAQADAGDAAPATWEREGDSPRTIKPIKCRAMFRTAYATARQFTVPVVLSRRSVAGTVETMIGTFIILNDEGWVLTAAHIVDAFHVMIAEEQAVANRAAAEAAIRGNPALNAKERSEQLRALGKTKPTDTKNCSAWWASDTATLQEAHIFPAIDLCIARLGNFNTSGVTTFPAIKDPSNDVEPGVSLCRLGFPFYSINASFDEARGAFLFPPEALPLPLFPIEGMLTRELIIPTDGTEPFPMKMLETSSPGLKGQSGGPIFDTSGTVWAVQSSTLPLALGFDPLVPNSGGRKEHQFLNVGMGAHCESICAALDMTGVKYAKSAY